MTMKRLAYGALLLAVSLLAGCGSTVAEKSTTSDVDVHLVAASKDFPNADLLVTPESVQANLGNSGLVIIDARGSGYDKAHVLGAISMIHNNFWEWGKGLKDTATLEGLLGKAGLTRDSKIVIYDNTSASWGAAGRIFWMLEYLGCTDVHIMNGGWDKWIADGRPVEAAVNTLPEKKFSAQVKFSVRATSAHIADRYQDSDFAIIDARTDEEFIGWQLYGETRGGHIPGAVQIPYEWYYATDKTVLNNAAMKALLESRGITRDKEVTSHCTVGIRSGYVYFILRLMGYSKASNYDASIVEWAADASQPMEKLPNYKNLVYPKWVKDLSDGKTVPNPPAHNYVFAAVGWEYEDLKTAIPGSIYINTDDVEEWIPDGYHGGNLWADATLQANIEKMGISKDTTVILYTRYTDSADPISAARVAWALMYAGVADVRMLNGGLQSWIASGYPTTAIPYKRSGITPVNFGATVPVHPEYLAKTSYVVTVVNGAPNAILADIRSKDEYVGVKDDYSYIDTLGRIPGAKWGHWGPATYQGGDFWDATDGTFRSYTEVAKLWKDYGITPADSTGRPNTISYYCGTGWRSSLAFFYGYLMGWNVKNYDGSWMEWSMGPGSESRPRATGWPY